MMMNLFNSFNPHSTMMMNFNWSSSSIIFLIIPHLMWTSPSRNNMLFFMLLDHLKMEMFILMKKKKNIIIFMTLFVFILSNNFMGLFPHIFTSSSHLVYSLSLSITLWISFMLYGWINNTNKMLAHLVPESTPMYLASFMVIIESISNIIRPKTLAIRLSANMIAGHMLLALIGSYIEKSNQPMFLIFIILQTMLMVLEMSVALIQSYVFTILSVLYSTETN